MIPRRLLPAVTAALAEVPAVALLGPRQAGKTTLAHEVAKARPAVYLDLGSEADRAKLSEPELYLSQHEDKLVILDEIQRTPQLFRSLQGLIDAGRRRARGKGRFLVLGSASIDLLKQSSESLAGRIRYLELAPLDAGVGCRLYGYGKGRTHPAHSGAAGRQLPRRNRARAYLPCHGRARTRRLGCRAHELERGDRPPHPVVPEIGWG